MEILDYFKLPEKAIINQRIYIKDIVSFIEATGSEKSLFEKSINTIHLVAILNVYQEIQIFVINLKNDSKIKQLNEEIHKTFPNPIVVIYKSQDKYLLSTALKRKNKLDINKSVIDSIQTTDWFKIDELHSELLSRINYQKRSLMELYESFDYILSAEYVSLVSNKVPEVIDYTIKEKSLKIQGLLEKKKQLIEQEKEESSMQGKMKCHMDIKAIDDCLRGKII